MRLGIVNQADITHDMTASGHRRGDPCGAVLDDKAILRPHPGTQAPRRIGATINQFIGEPRVSETPEGAGMRDGANHALQAAGSPRA